MCIAQSKASKVLGFTDACWELITTDRLLPLCSLTNCLQPEESLEEWNRSTDC